MRFYINGGLKDLIAYKKTSIKRISDITGWGRNQISVWNSGKHAPGLDKVEQLAEILKVGFGYDPTKKEFYFYTNENSDYQFNTDKLLVREDYELYKSFDDGFLEWLKREGVSDFESFQAFIVRRLSDEVADLFRKLGRISVKEWLLRNGDNRKNNERLK